MEFNYNFLLMVATISVTFASVNCLKCYSCNNNIEPKCGKTWELSDEDAAKYEVDCEGENASCKKIDTVDSHYGLKMVTRSCWTTDDGVDVDKEFYKCTRISKAGTACYCKDNKDGKPCNGQESLQPYMSLCVLLITAVVFLLV